MFYSCLLTAGHNGSLDHMKLVKTDVMKHIVSTCHRHVGRKHETAWLTSKGLMQISLECYKVRNALTAAYSMLILTMLYTVYSIYKNSCDKCMHLILTVASLTTYIINCLTSILWTYWTPTYFHIWDSLAPWNLPSSLVYSQYAVK